MPCYIKSRCVRGKNADADAHACTDVRATWKYANICTRKEIGMCAATARKKHRFPICGHALPSPRFIPTPPFFGCSRSQFSSPPPLRPAPPSVGVSRRRHSLLSPGHCHAPGPTENRGRKQERQRLSVTLACSRHHMPSLAHVTVCLEVPVEVH